ncbi:MAG: alpha-1,2-fucosyltransferase [Bacteroidales bacterium]|nr:alpha-1,2-fucosyltransferase [Bacteroidales bacterium]
MILSRIQGGLGNQMFQYALGRSLSLKLNKKLYLDISGMSRHVEGHLDRFFMLDAFNIKASIADEKILKKVKFGNIWDIIFSPTQIHFKQLVFDEMPDNKSYYKNSAYKVLPLTYKFYRDIMESRKGTIIFDGYWQSYKFFSNIEDTLKEDFVIQKKLNPQIKGLHEQIKACGSIAIHIRRSDYLTTEYGQKYYATIPMMYYQKALEYVSNKVKDMKTYIFSDDIEWCRTYFKPPLETIYISNEDPVEDFLLMQSCKHQIIANSTFSWWTAWLNQNPQKIIISPAQWYQHVGEEEMDELLPESWIKIK